MKIKNSKALSEWLEKKLRNLCEADPVALSKYVLALVEKDREVSELKQLCSDQLEVFLGQETAPFIESLFQAIASSSYIGADNGEASTPTEDVVTPPLPPTATDEDSPTSTNRASNRRHTEIDDEDRDFKRARRGRSSSSTPSPERSPTQKSFPSPISFHPSAEGAQKARSGSVGVKPKTWRGQGGGGRTIAQPRMPTQLARFPGLPSAFNPFMPSMVKPRAVGAKRERCKDFDEKGVCMLGESCPFDHGMDPLVVGPMMQWPMGGAQMGPTGVPPLGMPSAGVRAHGLPNLVMPGGFGQLQTPPGLPNLSLPVPVMSTGLVSSTSSSSTAASVEADAYNPENPSVSGATVGGGLGLLPQPDILPGVGGFPMAHPGGRPLQRGVKRPQRVPTDCLVVRNLPPEKNTVTELSNHFQQFGTIINIRVRFNNDQQSALVQFSSVGEAQKAFESSDAVCGNRFVKVFYFKVHEGGPGRRRGREEILEVTTGVQLISGAASVTGNEVTQAASQPPSTASSQTVSTSGTSTQVLGKGNDATAFGAVSTATPVTASHPLEASKGQPPLPLPPTNKALHAKQLALSKKVANLQKQLNGVEESLKKKRELQNKVQELINKQIEGQKLLIAKLDNSKSLSDAERRKVMETLKEVTSGVSKLNEQAQVMKAAILKLTNEKQATEVSLGEARADLKAAKDAERQLAESAKAELARVAQKKDLRNKLNKRKLVVMNVAKEDHLKLAQLFESVGQLLEVSVDPTNEENMIITFGNRVDAEKAVRSITSFNSKPVIMKWYSVPLQLPPQQMKVESAPVARAPLSVSPKLKKTLVLQRSERKLSESDDIKLLSPDSDCGGLLTPSALTEGILDDSLLDDDTDEKGGESKS